MPSFFKQPILIVSAHEILKEEMQSSPIKFNA